MLKHIHYFFCFILLLFSCTPKVLPIKNEFNNTKFKPGLPWLDTNGKPINAHGGGVLFHEGTYYWYGEHKIEGKSEKQMADAGIHCYSSKDLMNWKDEGLVLSVDFDNPETCLWLYFRKT